MQKISKAVIFKEPYKAGFCEDVALPEMDEESVMIQTQYSIISRGTEMDLYTGCKHSRNKDEQWYPMLPGYLASGIVIEKGKNVEGLQVGDPVIGSNLFGGYDPRYCAAWAGHMEYAVYNRTSHKELSYHRLVKVPEGVDLLEAPLAAIAAVPCHGIMAMLDIRPGQKVLVIGLGLIGNFAAQIAAAQGALVYCVEQFQNRIEIAKLNGLTHIIRTDMEKLESAVLGEVGSEKFDVVIEATGEERFLMAAVALVKEYGKIHAQGMYLNGTPDSLLRELFDHNIAVSASCGEKPEYVSKCLELMSQGKLTVHGMINGVYRPEEAETVYENVYRHPELYLTAAFGWQPDKYQERDLEEA